MGPAVIVLSIQRVIEARASSKLRYSGAGPRTIAPPGLVLAAWDTRHCAALRAGLITIAAPRLNGRGTTVALRDVRETARG
jgi:hypothetical protein